MKLKFGNRVVDPLVDFPFKKILGSTEHKNLTLHFLNAVMEALDLPRFADLEILNPFCMAEFEHEKEIELDIHARLDSSHEVQIEMQVRVSSELPERMIDNWARVYSRQLESGQDFDEHLPLYAIWIVNERFDDSPEWLRCFELRDSRGKGLSSHQRLIVLDLEAWRRSLPQKFKGATLEVSALNIWLGLFGLPIELDEPGRQSTPIFASAEMKEVAKIMEHITMTDQEWYLHEARRRYRMYKAGDERCAYRKGAMDKTIDDARNFKALGVAIEIICQATGLDRETVEGL